MQPIRNLLRCIGAFQDEHQSMLNIQHDLIYVFAKYLCHRFSVIHMNECSCEAELMLVGPESIHADLS